MYIIYALVPKWQILCIDEGWMGDGDGGELCGALNLDSVIAMPR
jgi:hypothetical protein